MQKHIWRSAASRYPFQDNQLSVVFSKEHDLRILEHRCVRLQLSLGDCLQSKATPVIRKSFLLISQGLWYDRLPRCSWALLLGRVHVKEDALYAICCNKHQWEGCSLGCCSDQLSWIAHAWQETVDSYLVDSASSHMLVSKIKPCMSKYKQICTVKLRMAH